MREENAGAHVALQVALVCAQCGARDYVPGDWNQKLIALRMLGQQRRWADDAIRGPGLTLLRWAEGDTLNTYLVSYGFMIFVVLGGMVQAFGALMPSSVPGKPAPPMTSDVAKTLALYVGMSGGVIGLSVATIATVFAIRTYLRRVLVPMTAAAPPEAQGRPARCRRCGADLTFGAHGVTKCVYCRAENFIAGADASAHVAAVAAATHQAQLHAAHSKRAMDRVNGHVQLAMMAAFLGGGPVGYILTATVAYFVLLRLG